MTVLNLQVGASADDAYCSDDAVTKSIVATTINFGRESSTVDGVSGFRFTNVTVPAGATISSAVLTLTQFGNNGNTPLINIYGEAIDNSTTFSTSSPNRTIDKARTTNYVAWQTSGTWYTNIEYSSPNLGNGANSPVGEVLGRANWASGNALTLICDGKNTGSYYKTPYAYDSSTTKCAKLSITYTAAASGTKMQINIGDTWKTVTALQINIGDVWKAVTKVQINIGDVWKTVFSLLLYLFVRAKS